MSASIQDTASQDVVVGNGHKRWRVVLVVGLVALLLTGAAYAVAELASSFSADRVIDRSELRFAKVVRGEFVREVMAQGRVVVANSPTLFSPEQGYVHLQVKAGDPVKKDQPLALVSSPELGELLAREHAQLSRLQADFAQQKILSEQRQLEQKQAIAMAEVQLKATQREKQRAQRAFDLKLISELDYEKSVDDLHRAQLQYDQASQNLSLMENAAEFYLQSLVSQSKSQELVIAALTRRTDALTILSPVDGMVGNIEVDQKQAVARNQPLITVVDLTAYEVDAAVAEGYASELSTQMQAKIRLNGEEYLGSVAAVSPEVVGGEVAVRIRFANNPPPHLRQNQRLTARIVLESRPDTLMVDRGPFFDGFRGHVYREEGDRAVKSTATLGARSIQHVEVISGLNEGDKIIISAIDSKATDQNILISR